ncbi:MAG: fibronectin type III domain-containing protein [Candidatus Omnitrophica bacterium]|nr:fibronectin type III domain-containing protein [Candidatus Omnitrophota bacterium]
MLRTDRVKPAKAQVLLGLALFFCLLYLPARAADTTPPVKPVVTDDGAYTSSSNSLHARWSSSDPESAITGYLYSIGTSAGTTNVKGWTAITAAEVTVTGLSLSTSYTYYFNVKAKNSAGLWSAVGSSNGIKYNRQPVISIFKPVDRSSFTEGDAISLYACATDADGDARQFQFSVDGVVKKPWSNSTSTCSYGSTYGTATSYSWQTGSGNSGYHKLKVEVRDNKVPPVFKEINIFIYRKPSGPP